MLKINYEKLDNISEDKRTDKSVCKNFIDPKIGDAKIYKSKKRLELRLKPAEFLKINHIWSLRKQKLSH